MALLREIPRRLTRIDKPRYVVFSDLDETYLAHDMTLAQLTSLRELESFLLEQCARRRLLFGWVTGSSLNSVLSKVERYGLGLIPHFVASSLGTELHRFDEDGRLLEDAAWDKKVRESGFSKERVQEAVAELAQRGVSLKPQADGQQGKYKLSYYHQSSAPERDIAEHEFIRAGAAAHRLRVNISQCNPSAGDPADCNDVDFIPSFGGKRQAVEFLLEQHGLGRQHALAFGDSGNDLEMLQAVGHGYLVENATAEAKRKHPLVAQGTYTCGILSTLQQVVR